MQKRRAPRTAQCMMHGRSSLWSPGRSLARASSSFCYGRIQAEPAMSHTRVSAWVGPTRVIHRLERLIHGVEHHSSDSLQSESEKFVAEGSDLSLSSVAQSVNMSESSTQTPGRSLLAHPSTAAPRRGVSPVSTENAIEKEPLPNRPTADQGREATAASSSPGRASLPDFRKCVEALEAQLQASRQEVCVKEEEISVLKQTAQQQQETIQQQLQLLAQQQQNGHSPASDVGASLAHQLSHGADATPAEHNDATEPGSESALPQLVVQPVLDEPTIIVVDGPPSPAKTGLLQKLRDLLPAPCLLISNKFFIDLLPESVRNGTRAAGPETNGEWVARCNVGMCGSIQALATSGNHLLIDFEWRDNLVLLRSLCTALAKFQFPLFINAGGSEHSGSAARQSDASLEPTTHCTPVVYDFDLGSLVGMDEETKMNVLDAVVLAHLESRRLTATIHSPVRRSGNTSSVVAAVGQDGMESTRQTALVATLGRLDASIDTTAM